MLFLVRWGTSYQLVEQQKAPRPRALLLPVPSLSPRRDSDTLSRCQGQKRSFWGVVFAPPVKTPLWPRGSKSALFWPPGPPRDPEIPDFAPLKGGSPPEGSSSPRFPYSPPRRDDARCSGCRMGQNGTVFEAKLGHFWGFFRRAWRGVLARLKMGKIGVFLQLEAFQTWNWGGVKKGRGERRF